MHPNGILVPEAPVQVGIAPMAVGERDGFKLTAVAAYNLRGRVLGTKRYHSGIQSTLVPVDVAVGWGKMSDQGVLDRLRLAMSNRFFFYRWEDTPPIPEAELLRSAANNHIVSANETITTGIRKLRVGQIVEMRGLLVDVTGPEGFVWPTSRRRDDTGNGACELFMVHELYTWNSLAEAKARPAVQISN